MRKRSTGSRQEANQRIDEVGRDIASLQEILPFAKAARRIGRASPGWQNTWCQSTPSSPSQLCPVEKGDDRTKGRSILP